MRQFHQRIVCVFIAIIVSSQLAFAGDAVFLVAGQFSAASNNAQFEIELLDSVTNAETLRFQTLSHSGGVSQTGLTVGSGGFDPIVEWIGISPSGSLGTNDDGNPGSGPNFNRDSLLSWQGVAGAPFPGDGYLKTIGGTPATMMAAGQYVLELSAYGPNYPTGLTKSWAIDIVATDDKIQLNDIDQSGSLTGLLFTGPAEGHPAVVDLNGNYLDFAAPTGGLLDKIHVGVREAGRLLMSSGAQINASATPLIVGRSILGVSSTMSLSDYGTRASVGTLTVQQGSIDVSGQASLASGNAQIGTNASYASVTVNGYNPVIGLRARWDITGNLTVGQGSSSSSGRGKLTIEQAGLVTVSGDALVDGNDYDTNRITVQTNGSLEIAGDLNIGMYSQVDLRSGGITANSLWAASGARFYHDDGTLTIDGGSFDPGLAAGNYTLDGADAADLPTVILDNGATMTTSGRDISIGDAHRGQFEVWGGSTVRLQGASDIFAIGTAAGGNGEAIVTGPGSAIETVNGTSIGPFGAGVLRVLDGGRVEDTASPWEPIAGSPGTTGLLEVSGFNVAPSTFRTRGVLDIGSAGVGTLIVSAGGLVEVVGQSAAIASSADASGSSATIRDAGSRFVVGGNLSVGASGGTGTLTIENGGAVEVAGTLMTTSIGSVELLGSSITCGSFVVEAGGAFTHEGGTLTVDGGPLNSAYYVSPNGADAGDNPTVVLTNGATLSQYTMTIGYDNPGTLRVLNGSTCDVTVAGGHLALGWHGGFAADGSLEVSGRHPTTNGPATVTTVAPLIVGAAGIGHATVGDGGQIIVDNNVYLAQLGAASTGTLTVDGPDAYLNVTGDVHVGGDPNYGDGGLAELSLFNESRTDVAGAMTIYNQGSLLIGGTLTANTIDHTRGGAMAFESGHLAVSTFLGRLVVDSGGWLHPGQSVGITTVSDGLEIQDGCTLAIEIDGVGSSDLLDVTGEAGIDGMVLVDLLGGFYTVQGDQWAIVHATDGITGAPIAPPGYELAFSDDNTTLYLVRSAPNLLGDANNDGVVSADDFAAVQAHFGSTGPDDGRLLGDANDDGVVSADDFASIQANFGNVSPYAAAAAPIPEPATLALLVLSATAVIRRRTW